MFENLETNSSGWQPALSINKRIFRLDLSKRRLSLLRIFQGFLQTSMPYSDCSMKQVSKTCQTPASTSDSLTSRWILASLCDLKQRQTKRWWPSAWISSLPCNSDSFGQNLGQEEHERTARFRPCSRCCPLNTPGQFLVAVPSKNLLFPPVLHQKFTANLQLFDSKSLLPLLQLSMWSFEFRLA